MAGGKETPRQKMINLMYLVFIAMLALNMSKEVLSAFGQINESLEDSSLNFEQKNSKALEQLNIKAQDQPEQFAEVRNEAVKVVEYTEELYAYLGDLKAKFEASVDDPKDYETMDKDAFVSEYFRKGDKLKPEGEAFLNNMRTYQEKMTALLGDADVYAPYVKTINEKFSAADVNPRDGGKNSTPQNYINYHFVGYPLISTITKLSNLQHDLKIIENEVLSVKLAGQLTSIASMDKYTTLLKQEKGAYFQGETFDGSIVLGREDASTVPSDENLKLNGRKLVKGTDYTIEGGRVKLNVTASQLGDQTIEGELIFKQDGEDVVVDVNQKFQVIPKPNQAIVSADKMNVVYRGVDNPITVSMPGVPENKMQVSASGSKLTKLTASSYILKPSTGKEVKVNVRGEVDGSPFNSPPVTFRIKSLPRPTGTVRGQIPEGKPIGITKNALSRSPIGAEFENFDFDISAVVKRFSVRVPGRPAVTVSGNTFDAAAQQLLNFANAGDVLTIFDIRADVPGVNVPSPTSFEVQLTN
ncbi:type IX secretion system motor protein PorM/GldM [Psychroflexus planctonicus]|uniref:Gliding motility protein GldM n=1 Tax=Psychroflexus planctonicus TaxID=1526575 RepID=A0ABQ1SHX8_9FLAO|nr:gliding motility protein GldM [Psychroflexus planctonicus]GGE37275.1 gliding motility protein GldM [Psychroflexus planctonicus]